MIKDKPQNIWDDSYVLERDNHRINELVIKSENVWSDAASITRDINLARAKLQALGFVFKEPTMIVPEHIYSYLEAKIFHPVGGRFPFSLIEILLNNSLVESITPTKSTESAVYLGVDVYDHRLFPIVKHSVASVTITDVNLSSEKWWTLCKESRGYDHTHLTYKEIVVRRNNYSSTQTKTEEEEQ